MIKMQKKTIDESVQLVNQMQNVLHKFGFKLEQDLSQQQAKPFMLSWEKDRIVIWTYGIIIEQVWFNSGSRSMPYWNGKFCNENVLNDIIKHYDNDSYCCCSCCKLIKKEEVIGSHFAGSYCAECWEKYKKENSRRCRLCGSPLYECCC